MIKNRLIPPARAPPPPRHTPPHPPVCVWQGEGELPSYLEQFVGKHSVCASRPLGAQGRRPGSPHRLGTGLRRRSAREGGLLPAPVHPPAEQTLPASSSASLASLPIPVATLPAIWSGFVQAQWIPGPESTGSYLGPNSPFKMEQDSKGLENNKHNNSYTVQFSSHHRLPRRGPLCR